MALFTLSCGVGVFVFVARLLNVLECVHRTHTRECTVDISGLGKEVSACSTCTMNPIIIVMVEVGGSIIPLIRTSELKALHAGL